MDLEDQKRVSKKDTGEAALHQDEIKARRRFLKPCSRRARFFGCLNQSFTPSHTILVQDKAKFR